MEATHDATLNELERSLLALGAVAHSGETAMLDKTRMKFSHVNPADTDFKGEGLRDFFLYRDLGVADATAGKVVAQFIKANAAPVKGTAWHRHGADFHIVYMLKAGRDSCTKTTRRWSKRAIASISALASGISCSIT